MSNGKNLARLRASGLPLPLAFRRAAKGKPFPLAIGARDRLAVFAAENGYSGDDERRLHCALAEMVRSSAYLRVMAAEGSMRRDPLTGEEAGPVSEKHRRVAAVELERRKVLSAAKAAREAAGPEPVNGADRPPPPGPGAAPQGRLAAAEFPDRPERRPNSPPAAAQEPGKPNRGLCLGVAQQRVTSASQSLSTLPAGAQQPGKRDAFLAPSPDPKNGIPPRPGASGSERVCEMSSLVGRATSAPAPRPLANPSASSVREALSRALVKRGTRSLLKAWARDRATMRGKIAAEREAVLKEVAALLERDGWAFPSPSRSLAAEAFGDWVVVVT